MIFAYNEVRRWCLARQKSFPRWDYGDLFHESFLLALEKVLPKWERNRASLAALLGSRLYDFVHRRYCKDVGITVTRPRTDDHRLGPREYVSNEVQWGEEVSGPEFRDPEPRDVSIITQYMSLGSKSPTFLRLYSEGISLKQLGNHFGISESAACQRLNKYKKDLSSFLNVYDYGVEDGG